MELKSEGWCTLEVIRLFSYNFEEDIGGWGGGMIFGRAKFYSYDCRRLVKIHRIKMLKL